MLDGWIFGQNAALVPHDPLGWGDLLHGGQVDDVVRSVEKRGRLVRMVAVLLLVLLAVVLLLLLLDHGQLAVLPLSGSLLLLMLLLLLGDVMVGRLVLDLSALTPDAADLEVVAVDGHRVAVARQHVVVVLPVPAQHADGQEDEQDEDASAGDWHCDGSRFEPQILAAISASNWLAVSEESSLHGNCPWFLHAWKKKERDNHTLIFLFFLFLSFFSFKKIR